jgi:hypothetical protein
VADSTRVAGLLLKALDSLEPTERGEVLEQLVGRALSPDPALPLAGRSVVPGRRATQLEFSIPLELALPATGQRTFPVRLPERNHARLKAWCEAHGFPMSVVVRGLLERFLDQQEDE